MLDVFGAIQLIPGDVLVTLFRYNDSMSYSPKLKFRRTFESLLEGHVEDPFACLKMVFEMTTLEKLETQVSLLH